MTNYFYLISLVLLNLFKNSESASCTSYSSETECNKNNLCSWSDTGDYCQCSSNALLDVMFVMDASGSVKSSGWTTEKEFVTNMIESGVDDESGIAIVEFSKRARAEYNFSDSQIRSDITAYVDSMAFTTGATWMKDALEVGMAVFEKSGDPTKDDILLLITDGNPNPSSSQAVCSDDTIKDALDAAGITVIVVGVGNGWSTSAISCLVDDTSTQIIYVDDFSDSAFDAVRDLTDTFLCPATISLALSEVRTEDSISDPDTNSRFVEFYVDGENIPLESNPLILNGLITGNITSRDRANLTAGSYVVFYDGSGTLDAPYCYKCDNTTCPRGSDGLCENAIYISCNGAGDECTMENTLSNSDWFIQVQDGSDLSYIVNVSVTKRASTWPSMTDGYTFELSDLTQNDQLGSNYEMSCYQYGTPGTNPIENCIGDCVVSVCQTSGDTSASCGSGADATCVCTTDDGYYRSGSTCLLLDEVQSCSTQTFREDVISASYFQTIAIEWSEVSVGSSVTLLQYEVNYTNPSDGEESTAETSVLSLYLYAEDSGEAYTSSTDVPFVRVKASTSTSGIVYSDFTECPITTSAPTKQPTLAPTTELPLIDNCTATILQGSYNVRVEWSEADLNSVTFPPDSIDGYYLFYSTADNTDETTSVTNGNLYNILSLSGYTDPFSADDLNVSVAAMIYDSSGAVDTDKMEAGATECVLASPAPTMAPSAKPTGVPSTVPSKPPSTQPTLAPTYEDWVLSNCTGNIGKGGSSLYIQWDQNSPVSSRTVRLTREISGSDSNTEDGLVTSARSETSATVNVGSSWTAFLIDDEYYIYPEALNMPGGSIEEQTGTYCSIVSFAPTPAPTNEPTPAPTAVPTDAPTSEPTGYPSTPPTPAPTYETLNVDCSYLVNRQDASFTVSFIEPDFDSNGVTTPLVANIRYRIEYNGNKVQSVGASSANSAYTTTVPLTDGFDLNEDVSVTVYLGTTEALGGENICNGSTMDPTPSPTTAAPTPAPTYPNPYVYIDIDTITSDPECAQSESTSEWECFVDESDETTTDIGVVRSPEIFPYELEFDWEIEFITDDDRRRRTLMKGNNKYSEINNVINDAKRQLLQNSATSSGDAYATNDDFSGATDGTVTVAGTTSAGETIKTVKLSIIQEDDDTSETQERFYFVLKSCEVTDDDDSSDIYDCSLGTPNRVLLYIANVADTLTTSSKTEPIPEWVWYLVGAAVLLLPLVGWFGWRFYNQKKLAEAMEAQRKQDLAEQMALDDAGNFGEIGDAVQFNPLATGGTKDIATGGDYIDAQLQAQKDTFEVAQVDIEQNVFRQDFGPVQTNSRV